VGASHQYNNTYSCAAITVLLCRWYMERQLMQSGKEIHTTKESVRPAKLGVEDWVTIITA